MLCESVREKQKAALLTPLARFDMAVAVEIAIPHQKMSSLSKIWGRSKMVRTPGAIARRSVMHANYLSRKFFHREIMQFCNYIWQRSL